MILMRVTLSLFLVLLPLSLFHRSAFAAPVRHGFVGVNTAVWDPNLDTPRVIRLLRVAGVTALRYPGGSSSDGYDWTSIAGTPTPRFARLAHALGADVTITANYGSGTPQMAAAWVAYCNAAPSSQAVIGRDAAGRDWKTAAYWAMLRGAGPLAHDDGLNQLRDAHPVPYGFRNWEIGNEVFGAWEYDRHRPQHDPVEYARFVLEACRLIKSVDPTARIGVVALDQVDGSPSQETVALPNTRQSASGWMPVVLSVLARHEMRPDFLALHHYAQDAGQESDAALFADAAKWPGMMSRLREMLTDFYGASAANVGIACTECNSVAFNPGPQTTGLANARYYAQMAPTALKLGVENLIWWDLHNARNTSGHDTHSSLNRFPYGDYGILGTGARQDQPYPVYDAIRRFATGQ